MSWAEEQARQIMENEERQSMLRQWALHTTEVRRMKAPIFYLNLVSYFTNQIEEFNRKLPSAPDRHFRRNSITSDSQRFWFHRPQYPEIRVDIWLSAPPMWIGFERRLMLTSVSNPTSDFGRFELQVDSSDELHLLFNGSLKSFEEVWRIILEPISS
jgi:hypothetical protein